MYYILDFIPQIGCKLPLEVQILEIQLSEWTSTYYDQSLMTWGGGGGCDDHVGELDSEDPS